MKTNFYIGQKVKYSNPMQGESDIRFTVIEIHEADQDLKEKLHVELICDNRLKPTFCYFSDEFTAE